MNLRVFGLVLLLLAAALSISWYRVTRLGAHLMPTASFSIWEVEARATMVKPPKRVRLSVDIPSSELGAKIIEESFRSDGLAAGLVEERGARSVFWTGKPNNPKLLRLSYVALMERGTQGISLPKKIKPVDDVEDFFTEREQFKARELVRRAYRETKTPDAKLARILRCVRAADCPSGDFLGRYRVSQKQLHRALASILNEAGFRSYVARGFEAEDATKNASFVYWVRSFVNGNWLDLTANPANGFTSDTMIFWEFLLSSRQRSENEEAELEYSLVPIEDFGPQTSIEETEYQSRAWRTLSLRNLPISVQASYRIMLLIPIGALIIALYRSILGFPTFGTFLPVLVSLAFRDTGLVWGLVLLSLIVTLGLLVRSLLTNLRLLLVPRLAASLSIVIMLILLISRLSHDMKFIQGLTVTLFPIVIVTMLIERMSISWEESGARKTLMLFFSSMCCSVLCYAAMMPKIVQYWVFTFPEIMLLVLALTILCGRYTGYRLSELYRFRSFGET